MGRLGFGVALLGGLLTAFAAPVRAADSAGTAQVRHAPMLNGRVEGSVHQMLPESATFNGGAALTGQLLAPGTPTVRINGNPVFGGATDGDGSATPTNYQITLNGGSSLGGLVRRTDPVALPTVAAPLAPSGSRSVNLNNATDSPGDWATLRNLTLNSNAGTRAVPPGAYGDFTANGNSVLVLGVAGATTPATYHLKRLTLNGQSRLDVVGPVVLNLANHLNANGSLGDVANPAWLTLNFSSGGLTLNGSVSVYAHVTAPSGSVTINGNTQLVGGLVADRLTLNGNGLLRLIPAELPNEAPSAEPLALAVERDRPLPIALRGADPEGAPLAYRIVSAPAHGTVAFTGSDTVLYTPANAYLGADAFTYLANDGKNDSAPATVSLTIAPPPPTLVTVMRDGAPLAGVTVYAYDEAGASLSYSRKTDAAGAASFTLASGSLVKFRVDRDGRQLFSEVIEAPAASFTFTLPGTTTVTLTKAGAPLASRTVYAYLAATTEGATDTYLGYARSTDAEGVARFCLDEGQTVKFRADDGGARFFSATLTTPGATTLALPADTVVTVMRDGAPLASVTVYAYDEAGASLSYSRKTDAAGTASFTLASGSRVKFRVDRDGRQLFSDVIEAPAAAFTFTLPGTTTVTLTKAGAPLASRTVYAYLAATTEGAADTYLGYARSTDAEGVARFCLDEGQTVKFRADDGGARFFSATLTTPGATTLALPADTVVTVMRDGAPLAGVTVYAYDEAGASLSYSRKTDDAGSASFTLASGSRVKFRVDRDGRQLFSEVIEAPAAAFTFTVPGTTTVTLTKAGAPLASRTVYAYLVTTPTTTGDGTGTEGGTPTAADTYLGYARSTDAEGVARFCLDEGQTVKFRADDGGARFFSAALTTPGAVTLALPADTVVTVMRDGAPLASVTVYAYDEAGASLSYSRKTDAAGTASFTLASGSRVKFRVDRDGRQLFSEVIEAPAAAFTFTLPGTTTVTLTKAGAPLASRTVYAYLAATTEGAADTYLGYARSTDAEGVARFCLDEGQTVKFRADDGGARFFSAALTTPGAATLALPADTVVTVMRDGAPLAGVTVYAYDEAGASLSYSRKTDAAGTASFTLASGSRVKFRVDRDGRQLFSEVIEAPATAFTFTLPGTTTVTLTKAGAPLASRTVYAYLVTTPTTTGDGTGTEGGTPTAADTYLGYARSTDAEGVARFCLDEGQTVKFRADDGGARFFSAALTTPGAATLALPADTVVTVTRDGAPVAARTIYAFDEAGASLSYSRKTDASGVAVFSLADGRRVKFRVDDQGERFFSEVQTAPATYAWELPPSVPEVPVVTQALLDPAEFTRGGEFVLAVSGERIASGIARFDFVSAEEGGALLELPLGLIDGAWVAAGRVPASVPPDASDASAPRSIPVTLVLTGPTGEGATVALTFPLVADTVAPLLGIDQPTALELDAPATLVSGTVGPDAVALFVQTGSGPAAPLAFSAADGRFSIELPLAEGLNAFALVARDRLGNEARLPLQRLRTPHAPELEFSAPPAFADPEQTLAVNTTTLRLAGRVTDTSPLRLTLDGVELDLDADGAFSLDVPLPLEGANALQLVAEDALGLRTVVSRTVYRLTQAPALSLGFPAVDPFITRQPLVQLSGTVGEGTVSLTLNSVALSDFSTGAFVHPLTLQPGNNSVVLEVRDAAGNSRVLRRTLVLDQTPPAFLSISPVDGLLTSEPQLTVSGRVEGAASLLVGEQPATLSPTGDFAAAVTLREGSNRIVLRAADAVGNSSESSVTVLLDTVAPELTLTSPAAGAVVSAASVTITGRVDDPAATVGLAGGASVSHADGVFSLTVPLAEGANTFVLRTADPAGNSVERTLSLTRDSTAPRIAFTAPAAGLLTRQTTVRVAGTLDDPAATVSINGRPALVSGSTFELADLALSEGANPIVALATDTLGNVSAPLALTVTSDRTPPAAPALLAPPAFVKTDRIALAGTTEPGARVRIQGGLTALDLTADASGAFAATVLLAPNQAADLLIRATDAAGNESAATLHRVVSDLVAPRITLLRPTAGAAFERPLVEFEGSVADTNLPASLLIAGQTVPLQADGRFAAALRLPDGADQNILLSVTDAAGNLAELTRTISVSDAPGDASPPVIVVLSPAYDALVPSATLSVTALVSDESALSSVVFGGQPASPSGADGLHTASVTADANGEFTLVATDAQGLVATITHRVRVEGAAPPAPLIQRVSPEGPTAQPEVLLYASATPGLRYELSGALLPLQSGLVAADGRIVAAVQLRPNTLNSLALRVVSAAGVASPEALVELRHDSVPPAVLRTTPAASAAGVALAAAVVIEFDEPLVANPLPAATLSIDGAPVAVSRALSADGATLILSPSSPLPELATVRVSVPASVRDLAGNALAAAHEFTFRTLDSTAPAAPVPAAVPARTHQTALALSGTAEPGALVEVAGAAAPASVLADASGRFTLTVTLLADQANQLSLTARDAAGNLSPAALVNVEHDGRPFTLLGSVPAASATAVATEAPLGLSFNKAVDPASLGGLLLVTSGGASVPVSVAVGAEPSALVLAPAAALASATAHELIVPATLADLFGNRLGQTLRIGFTTVQTGGPAVPILYSATPAGATTLTAATLSGFSTPGTRLLVAGGASDFEFPTDGVIDTTGLFTLTVPLRADAQNDLTLRARDAEGRLSAIVPALSVRQDSIPPVVVATSPVAGASGVSAQAAVFVEFSEAIRAAPLSATPPAIRLFDAQNAVVAGSWVPSGDGRSVTFHPTRGLDAEARYKLLVGTAVRDLAGNALAAPLTLEFTTAPALSGERPAAPVLDPLPERTTELSVTVSGSAAAGATIRVFGGQGGGATTADAQGRFSLAVQLVPDALNPLAVVAVVDDAVGESALASVRQVRHAAALRILSPRPGLEYNNRSVTVAGVLDDPAAAGDIVITGPGLPAEGLAASRVGRYFFRQVVLDAAAGAKSLSASADTASGEPLSASVAFSLVVEPAGVDTRAPIPAFIFPEAGDLLNGEVVEALLTVEEGVRLTHVEIDDVVAHDVVGNIFLIHAKLPLQGANTLTVRATDAAGLVGSASVEVLCDSVGFSAAPAVAALPSRTAERVIQLTGTAEAGATIVVINGLVPVRTVVGADGTFSVAVPLNPNAANTLQVVATDAAGNLSPVATVAVAHDDTAPRVLSTSPADAQSGVPVDATIEIRFSEALAPESVAAAEAVRLTSALGQTIQPKVLLSADGKTLRVTPAYKLLRGDTVTVELAASIADLHGFTLGAAQSFAFTTAAYRTTVSGVVVDEQLRPLPNIRVGLVGTALSQRTSSFGTFLLDAAPVGDQLLYIDGRPDTLTGESPQGDARVFGYLEFALPVRQDQDNSLGRPIFMVETDFSTATPLLAGGGAQTLVFQPTTKDLAGFALNYGAGAGRFGDGSTRGSLTVTRIDPAHIPDRLPSGAIPHFLVEIGPDDLVFAEPASLVFPNVYGLAAGDEVIVFHFKYGVHDYTELGRATVGADGRIVTGPLLVETGFVGIVPASGSIDLARSYLQGRVVDAAGRGIAGIPVNAIAGSTRVLTDAEGRYSIALPEVRLERLRTYATVSTDLGARAGEAPSLVFQSPLVSLLPSGVTAVPDIVVDSFFLGGGIRFRGVDGGRLPVTGLAYDGAGRLTSVAPADVRAVEILVYRRLAAPGALWEYDSEPYLRATASLDPSDDRYDASFSLAFLGSLSGDADAPADPAARAPVAGDVVKLVAFDPRTGCYGESELRIPSASEAAGAGGDSALDVVVNLELHPPLLRLDMNRVFFLDGVRRRANIPHRGIAFTSDEFIEFSTVWTTAVATPLDRPELRLSGRLRVNSIGYQTDYAFPVRGGEHARVLELREGVFADRLAVLQRETDVGVETFTVSPDGSFAAASLLPVEVRTDAYGLAQASAEPTETSSRAVELHILDLSLSGDDDGLDVSGRTLPGGLVRVGDGSFTADANGYFGGRLDGELGAGGLGVQVGSSLSTRFGEALAPVIDALDATPPGLVPDRGAQGDLVTIHGRNFSPVTDDNKVAFNGAVAAVESASETRLTVRVPELASSGDVTVTVGAKRSNGVRFEFLSVGINNGSFEDGTLRAFTLEGSGRVVERWKRLEPTHRQFMAFLDTMADPRDGLSSLTSDAFEVPEGMRTLLFDYHFAGTTLLKPVREVLEFQILVGSQALVVNELFDGVALHIDSANSGFERGSGFRTAAVSVAPWAGTGERLRVRVVLKGRGALPARIPGMDTYDADPLGFGKNAGTGLFLDHFRLSAADETALPPLAADDVMATSDGTQAQLSSAPGLLPTGSRVWARLLSSGRVFEADVGADGRIALAVPFPSGVDRLHLLVSHASPPGPGELGRLHAPPLPLEVAR